MAFYISKGWKKREEERNRAERSKVKLKAKEEYEAKGLFIWSRVPETTLPPSYPWRDIFPLICLKNYINRLHEVVETTRVGETTRGGELSSAGRVTRWQVRQLFRM